MKPYQLKNLKSLGLLAVALLLLNFISHFVFYRVDLTQDKRFTLTQTTKDILDQVKDPLIIDVFLEGNFPGEFKKLQNETKQLLEEYVAYNSNISYQFVNPIAKEEERIENMKRFYDKGMMPINVTVDEKGKQTQEVVFPWAVANYGTTGAKVQLLKNMMGASIDQKVLSSVQHLEYAFTDAINKIVKEKQKKIAVIKGNGELEDMYIADFLRSVKDNYYIGPITLDSVAKQPKETLKALSNYDLAIIAKPTEKFSEEEKQVLDQYIMNGGKTMWLLDAIQGEVDSLYNASGTSLIVPRDLNLTDMLFKYGVRLNSQLIKDEMATPITLMTGEQGSESQKQQFQWKFAPFIYPSLNHPIVKNIEGVKFDFCSPIEVLNNSIKKTILLESSKYSKEIGLPTAVSLNSVTEETNPKDYPKGGFLPVAVLLEGKFTSMYKNRVLPYKDSLYKFESKKTQMIVISDGDVIKNQLDNGAPLELGFDKWTNNLFGNKEFILNCVNYLLDDNGLINIRNKEVRIPTLDKAKVADNYNFTQIITVALPLILLAIFGVIFTSLRKKKYAKKFVNN